MEFYVTCNNFLSPVKPPPPPTPLVYPQVPIAGQGLWGSLSRDTHTKNPLLLLFQIVHPTAGPVLDYAA